MRKGKEERKNWNEEVKRKRRSGGTGSWERGEGKARQGKEGKEGREVKGRERRRA